MKQARQLLILVLSCLGSFTLMAQGFTAVEANATLDGDCQFVLTPENVLKPDPDDDDDISSFVVRDADNEDDDDADGATIDGCGRFIYEITINGVNLWGYVNAEDKTPPVVVTTPIAPTLVCSDLPFVVLTGLTNAERCYTVQRSDAGAFTTVAGTMSAKLRARLILPPAGTPTPNGTTPLVVGFRDACSDQIEVCVRDVVQYDAIPGQSDMANCGTDRITRIFTAREIRTCKSASGESVPEVTASFDIDFVRFGLADVDDNSGGPATIECTDSRAISGNFAPAADEYPSVTFNGREFFLADAAGNSRLCNLAVSYEDGTPSRQAGDCATNFKFIREYRVIDWCAPTAFRSFIQIVKVGDSEGPELQGTAPTSLDFSTNAGNRCGAFLRLDNILDFDDECNEFTVSANIFPNADLDDFEDGDLDDVTPLGSFDVDNDSPVPSLTSFIPAGDHLLCFTAVDVCGNATGPICIEISIVDRTAPVAICEDGLNISLSAPTSNVGASGTTGVAVLTPHNIDNGSYDDCSGIVKFIARDFDDAGLDAGDATGSETPEPYGQQVVFTCADLGTQQVSLKVQDAEGNMNFCWLDVLIEDKNAPFCLAPDDLEITCLEYRDNFPNDISQADSSELAAMFGSPAVADDCAVSFTIMTMGTINSCGEGEFTRTFKVTDGRFSAENCVQTVTVVAVHDYSITFPQDESGDCAMIPSYDGLEVDERACDLITTEVDVDTFRSTTAADFCFKLEITYDVINWCEYNTIGQPYLIPRDGKLAEAGGVDRDPETEDLYLHVRPNRSSTDDDDFAFLSRQGGTVYNSSAGNARNIDRILDDGDDDDDDDNNGSDNDDDFDYEDDDSRGFFRYVQFIKIYDEVAPVLTADSLDDDCDFGAGGADCTANPQITFTATDECTATFNLANLLIELDADYNSFTGFSSTRTVRKTGSNREVVSNGDGTFTVNLQDIPVGTHALRIQARDGCGNFNVLLIPFDVCADKAPAPICIQTLTVTLMPTQDGAGMAAIWASDFIASPITDCEGAPITKYSIYRDGEQPATVSPADTGLVLTCADISEDTPVVLVRVYAIDDDGNADYCQVNIDVQAFRDGLCEEDNGSSGALAGLIATSNDQMMSGVEVSLTGANNSSNMVVTGTDGAYAFEGLTKGVDYTIQPAYSAAVDLNQVKTSDIRMIVSAILATEPLTNAYQQIAADVNQDGNIDVLDVVGMRRVILGLDNGFANGISYRFVPVGFEFANNSYAATFPEVYNINNLAGNFRAADFVAVQLGNVNGNYIGNSTSSLNIEDAQLEAGQTHTIVLSTEAAGFQGTLELAAGLELVDVRYGAMEAGNLNLNRAAEGLIAMSYLGEGAELLSIDVRATTAAKLSDLVSLTSRVTVTEGVDAAGNATGLNLNFAASTVEATNGLAQNVPNPVVESTRISYTLGAAAPVTFTVQDVQGRVVLSRELEGVAGTNVVNVSVNDLGVATGVLSYTVTAGDFTATKKMVVVRN